MKKEPDKIKKARTDRSDKLKLRKSTDETVVKSTLLNYLLGDQEVKLKFINAIQSRVLSFSKRINMASLSLNEIIKISFNGIDDVCDVVLPNIFDQTFIRQLMLGTDGVSKVIDHFDLKTYLKENPSYLCTRERQYYDSNIYSAGAIKYITNLKNSLIFNLEKRIKKFTKIYQEINQITDNVRLAMLYKINRWKMPESIANISLNNDIINECEYQRYILGIDENEIINPESIIPENILKYYVYLNRFYESIDKPMFNLVPICNIKLHYITIDKYTFYGILKEIKVINCNEKIFNDYAEDHIRSIINISKLQGRYNTFTGTIETDGIIMCTHFTRPKQVKSISEASTSASKKLSFEHGYDVKIPKDNRVVAIDPGRINIYYGVENKTKKIYKLTRRQYYKESGIVKANKQSITWQRNIKKELVQLSLVSTKGSNLIKHKEYIKTYLMIYDSLWNEYTKSRWSRQRFRLYGGKKRVFAKFFNSIKNEDPTRRVTIAFGDGKFSSGGKNEQCVATTRAFKECSLRFNCKVVNEFRTSKIHHEDDSILKRVAFKDAIQPKNWLRGLLWCSSTNNSKFVNRDFNGAMNILRCALLAERPLILQRQENQGRLIDQLGKKIKRCHNA